MTQKIKKEDLYLMAKDRVWKERRRDSGRHEVLRLGIDLEKLPKKIYGQTSYIRDEEHNQMIIEIPISNADIMGTTRIKDAESVFWYDGKIIVWFPAKEEEGDEYSIEWSITPEKGDYTVNMIEKDLPSAVDEAEKVFWRRD